MMILMNRPPNTCLVTKKIKDRAMTHQIQEREQQVNTYIRVLIHVFIFFIPIYVSNTYIRVILGIS